MIIASFNCHVVISSFHISTFQDATNCQLNIVVVNNFVHALEETEQWVSVWKARKRPREDDEEEARPAKKARRAN